MRNEMSDALVETRVPTQPSRKSSGAPDARSASGPLLEGRVGEVLPAREFPIANRVIDDVLYDYEGNWAFCRFRDGPVEAIRFGYGRGMFDGSDYGGTLMPKSFLMLHLEVMFKEGAVLWIGSGKYVAAQMKLSSRNGSASLGERGRTIISHSGWPNVRWRIRSDDGVAGVDLSLRLKAVTLLPDNRMQRNLFAMWLAIGEVKGSVQFQGSKHAVEGSVFYDHPRIVLQRHRVPAFGWNLYTPLTLEDGSYFAAHFTQDAAGRDLLNYCFALHLERHGAATWLPRAELLELRFDADEKPERWKIRWKAPRCEITMDARVRGTRILKAWGKDGTAQTRRENPNIPLVFDAVLTIANPDGFQIIKGGGLAEYMKRATWF